MRTILPFFAAILLMFGSSSAHAVSLIRDAEIEHTLRLYADPIFKAAGLEPKNVRIFIVNSDVINAFVAGGANIFLHTELIKQSQSPAMLIGVIAHETGHIAGGHLARGAERYSNAQLGMLLGYVLGAGAAAAGQGDVGMAVMTGSQNIFGRNLLAHSRTQEQSADQAGMSFLDSLKISSSGLLDMFALLRRNEMKQYGTIDPYLQTHPLSKERIESVRSHTELSKIPEGQYPKSFDILHKRMLAKLYGFMDLPPKTFARYPQSDHTVPARMARAIAWYKMPELGKALSEMNALIKDFPDDPYLYELKGQILFENGKIADALTAYTKAAQMLPEAPLVLTALAEVQLALNKHQEALQNLEKSTRLDETNSRSWRLLATAHGKLGNKGMSTLALAEEAALTGEHERITALSTQALKLLPENSPAHLRAEDLKRLAAQMKKDEDKS